MSPSAASREAVLFLLTGTALGGIVNYRNCFWESVLHGLGGFRLLITSSAGEGQA
ncbi:MAG: hypothetical protein O2968_21200 [Acidobacteria bacterium]|nr:hypothetical protein [Acidobacteriota bacterium]